MDKKEVLGVGINDVSLDQAVEVVEGWLTEKPAKKYYIVTPNPEFLMAADKDAEFKKILNKADLAIPDGAGLKLSGLIKNTTTGTDLMEKLCEMGTKKGWKIGLLGGRRGAADECSKSLEKKYPGLKIVFAEEGGEVDSEGNEVGSGKIDLDVLNSRILEINSSRSRISHLQSQTIDLLFVAFGQVKQEKWIANNLDKIPVKVTMGVGGAFDYFGGLVPRAPLWMRNLGLEWLFRLILQPWRIKRQIMLLKYIWLIRN
jgi:N-acetylglucosaminyldiphosphoundecaprenol N-acetyl-beta-D-mannosaminyltransferase